MLRGFQHAEVVKRSSAAKNFFRNIDVKTGGLQNFDGSFADRRMKKIGEGIDPENYSIALTLPLSQGEREHLSFVVRKLFRGYCIRRRTLCRRKFVLRRRTFLPLLEERAGVRSSN